MDLTKKCVSVGGRLMWILDVRAQPYQKVNNKKNDDMKNQNNINMLILYCTKVPLIYTNILKTFGLHYKK